LDKNVSKTMQAQKPNSYLKTSSSDSKKYPPGFFMGRLRERKIIAILAAFMGGGVAAVGGRDD